MSLPRNPDDPPAHHRLGVLVRRLWAQLGLRRRRQVMMLCALILVSGLCEMLTLGAVVPFLAILTAPDAIMQHALVAQVSRWWGVTSSVQLVLPLAALFAGAALAAGGVRLLLLWCNERLAYAISGDFAVEIYRRTLYQPYAVHARRNSSSVLSTITQKTDGAIKMLIAQLTVATSGVQLVALTCAIVAVNPAVAGFAGMCLGSAYGLLTWRAHRLLRRNSHVIARQQTSIIQVVQEGLGGIRDVLLEGAQNVYSEKYRQANTPLRRAQSVNNFIMNGPRFVLEAFGIMLVAALAVWTSRGDGGLSAALPVLGVLALGAQRMLPLVQIAYASWSSMMANVTGVSEVLDLLDQRLPPEALAPPSAPIELRQQVRFESVRFRYSEQGPWVLNGITLSIPRGSRIGIVGETGAGKSTFSDILMGLLEPTEGALVVDGQAIVGPRVRAWQRAIAHVPQSIYLSDATIAENIAFGVPVSEIDMARVQKAAAQAQIATFIEGQRDGYFATVGERGVRLSGGERQRIGIARALYKHASVLVLDEATSALDSETEQAVMDTIEALDRELTIVVIAHRLSTIRRCERFVELCDGVAVEYDSYQRLLERRARAPKVVAVG